MIGYLLTFDLYTVITLVISRDFPTDLNLGPGVREIGNIIAKMCKIGKI